MQAQALPVCAAIDIGSNTIHVVIARCWPDTLDIVAEETEMVRIGESVGETGKISQEKQEEALAAVQRFQDLAQQHGAETVLAVATEAIRKASNGNEFLEQIQQKTGLHVELISGDVEAVLTFFGATYELAQGPNAPEELGVMDLGGGSTELITAKHMRITWRTSLHTGSGQLHDSYLHSDPPTREEIEQARAFLQKTLQDVQLPQRPPALVVTGSSATALLQLAQRAFRLEAESDRLAQEELLNCAGLLYALPAEEIARRYGQNIERARILPAGALALQTVIQWLDLDEVRTTPHGLRHGVLLAYARYGENWLDEVKTIASKQGKEQSSLHSADTQGQQKETFMQFGRHLLPRLAKKFLKWPAKILKQGDAEAIHKMRVASRRLRAALDAYQKPSKPKPFKKAYRQLKKLADTLGSERDSDVMLQGLHTRLEEVTGEERAGLQWFIQRLDTYHQKRQDELESALRAFDEDAFKHQVQSCLPKGGLRNGKG